MKTVLVVDDEADILEFVCLLLESEGLELLAASDGEEALRVVRQRHPDLVLADVMMPRMDGRELCRRVDADPETRGIPVVLMSAGHWDPADCGARGLIPKPFADGQPEDTVRRILAAAA